MALLDGDATVPFIARYRKEATGGLDDTQLRALSERLIYLRELEDRRAAILKSIDEQGKLTPELSSAIADADSKARLEDLYLPYKQKRRTKAQIAREAGLEPLALHLHGDPSLVPEATATAYIDAEKGVPDAAAALDGARWILIERFSEDADLIGGLRQLLWDRGEWKSTVVPGKEEEGAKFSDYFSAAELVKKIPSHRTLALLRGRDEGALRLSIVLPVPEGATGPSEPERRIAARQRIERKGRAADAWLAETVRLTWKVRLLAHLEVETEQKLRQAAEVEAIRVFGRNLHDLLLAAPAGQRITMGLDPGIRTGVKVAVVDGTGRLLETTTVYPHPPRNDRDGTLRTLAALSARHGVQLVSIGNGTASRETDQIVTDLIRWHPELTLTKAIVSEAGASVYSASELAAKEFPDLDVTLRGAVSIARRLQDPLAELVRIDPKAIGVGQYQHDVSKALLAQKLDAVVEDCVNAVGADVNTASVPLLARISGLAESTARNIVAFRDANGPFRDRRQILKVPRLGERTFLLAAGFLRIVNGDNPLDASAVHPEAYPVVERIVASTGLQIRDLMGQASVLRALQAESFADERFGVPTVRDILAELEKPGRDPRPEFKAARFKDGVHELGDLMPGMLLEGVVTNVANFGAFVDVGVHQDGLVHVSQLADRFVKDPHDVVKAGDIVKVKVVEIDVKRRRIALTMKVHPSTSAQGALSEAEARGGRQPSVHVRHPQVASHRPEGPAVRPPLGRSHAPAPKSQAPTSAPATASATTMGAAFAAFAKAKSPVRS